MLRTTLREESRCGFSPVSVYLSTSCSCFKKLDMGERLELAQPLWFQGVAKPCRSGSLLTLLLQGLTEATAHRPQTTAPLPPPSYPHFPTIFSSYQQGPPNQSPSNLLGFLLSRWDLCHSPNP